MRIRFVNEIAEISSAKAKPDHPNIIMLRSVANQPQVGFAIDVVFDTREQAQKLLNDLFTMGYAEISNCVLSIPKESLETD
ncbi:hypothetical protein J6A31_05535 [bacterium]|nr:hypothetical protein [bacterium]